MASADMSQFEIETAVSEVGPHTWLGHLSQEWNINTNPNGGYALSMLLRAMKTGASGHPDPVSVGCHFLRPSLGGQPAEISIDVVRSGRRTSTVRGELAQGAKPRLVSLATFADLNQWRSAAAGRANQGDASAAPDQQRPQMPGPDSCLGREGKSQGVSLALLSRVEVRLDPTYTQPSGTPQAVVQGWIRLADGAPSTVDCLPLFADCFPPSIFSRNSLVGWVPTVELTVHVRNRPSPGWIQARFETSDLGQGLMIEDGVLWDEEGKIVAQSRQLAVAPDAT